MMNYFCPGILIIVPEPRRNNGTCINWAAYLNSSTQFVHEDEGLLSSQIFSLRKDQGAFRQAIIGGDHGG
jgi:hypothetical protein